MTAAQSTADEHVAWMRDQGFHPLFCLRAVPMSARVKTRIRQQYHHRHLPGRAVTWGDVAQAYADAWATLGPLPYSQAA